MLDRAPQVLHAVVLADDGTPAVGAGRLDRAGAEHLAGVACCLHGLARGAGRSFRTGEVRQTLVEMDAGLLLVAATGDGSALAVLADAAADIGTVAYETARLVHRLHDPPGEAPPADR
ncbi:roadblock/LC7 domain-containing protein [Streptomyces sp. 549]|nr:roadblock/LC7 domain-containing protein [Streptomyces sp. 549]MDK1474652.1 roadblock/LC7 domain-containing protein [Streptomyces sp. 549]